MAKARQSFIPRMMQARAASDYLGMSETKLRESKIPTKIDGGNVWYDVRDLDAWADAVPYSKAIGGNSCDGLFQ